MNSYAGVGMRNVPEPLLRAMEGVAKFLATSGYTLRSGASHGSDKAFERGCDSVDGSKEIYLPWKHFNQHKSHLYRIGTAAMDEAKLCHPDWDAVTQSSRRLLFRNVYQVLGMNMDDPCKFVICYTKYGKLVGGTGQTIRIASKHNIPIINLGSVDLDTAQEHILKLMES